MNVFSEIGEYLILLKEVFKKPEKKSLFFKQILSEMDKMGLTSLGIVAIISTFMGAVVAIQTAANINSPLIPAYTLGFAVRSSTIFEFSPTIICLILAGKVGSSIASEIGTMRVTEQIDELQIMGVNPASFLILPKIIASVIIFPALITISMFLGVFGGFVACVTMDLTSTYNFISGIQLDFRIYDVFYAIVKTITFAFLITSISGYNGYRIKGGAVDVGRASTKAVVTSSIYIIIFNLILTKLLLL